MKGLLRSIVLALIAVAMLMPLALAQDEKAKPASSGEEWKYYKLDFLVRELEDGKTVNTRTYTLMTKSNDWQQLRVGTRVPVLQGKMEQINYVDVGLQVDCRIQGDRNTETPALVTKAEISSFAINDQDKQISANAPIIRRVQMNATSPLVLGKPMVISGADELGSKHRFQLEVTATALK